MRELPEVTLIVPVYNGGSHYPTCFESLCRLSYPADRLEVHIIDDGSTDGTREYLRAQNPPPFVHIHLLAQNVGLGQARNYGLEKADGEVVILLDGDMEAPPDFVDAHVAELTKPGREVVIGQIAPAAWIPRTKLNRYLYEYPHRGARQYGPYNPISFQYLLSSNAAFSRAAIEAGNQYEPFSHYGGEETIFAYKVARKFPNGIFYSEKSVAFHQANRSFYAFLKNMKEYGYHNLPLIVSRHPEISTPLAADFAWPLPGKYFRHKRTVGRLLFNFVSTVTARLLLTITPVPLSHILIRFLLVSSVVRGLRRYVREHRPEPQLPSKLPGNRSD